MGCSLWGRIESDTTEATWQQQQQHSTHIAWLLSLKEKGKIQKGRTHINISLKQPAAAALILALLQGREIALTTISLGFPSGSLAKNPPAN